MSRTLPIDRDMWLNAFLFQLTWLACVLGGVADRWEYVLQGQEPPATHWLWLDWQWRGPLRLANERRRPDGSARIEFDPLEVLEQVPPDAFAPP